MLGVLMVFGAPPRGGMDSSGRSVSRMSRKLLAGVLPEYLGAHVRAIAQPLRRPPDALAGLGARSGLVPQHQRNQLA